MSLIDLFALIKQIRSSKRGVSAMEFAVIACAIIITIAATIRTIGFKTGNSFSTVSSKLG